MKYSIKKIKILQESINKHLTKEEKEIVREIIEDYNRIFAYARRMKDYIQNKNTEWTYEMNKNHKLIEENIFLKEKLNRTEIHRKSLMEEIKQIKGR